MKGKTVSGNITLCLALGMVFLGLTSQVWKNYMDHNCGQTLMMTVMPLLVQVSRAVHTAIIRDWYILIPDTIGAVLSLVLLWQWYSY